MLEHGGLDCRRGWEVAARSGTDQRSNTRSMIEPKKPFTRAFCNTSCSLVTCSSKHCGRIHYYQLIVITTLYQLKHLPRCLRSRRSRALPGLSIRKLLILQMRPSHTWGWPTKRRVPTRRAQRLRSVRKRTNDCFGASTVASSL